MSARHSTGWQTALADLSLILFMVTALAVSRQPSLAVSKLEPAPREDLRPSPEGEPLAIYVAAPGAPPLAQWIAGQAADARQQLTITARYAPGGQAAALADAARLAGEAGAAGKGARLVIEPGAGPIRAALAFDAVDPALARSLQGKASNEPKPKDTK